ncbi:TlyA family RNA methyltransferase [[Eubacterium] hominis]|uniref:TlyA family RNA methyltransferase n=1 Tax=[Eubacterium] hominis TaxID=2764325 RepID=UPI003A4DAE00
MRLDQYLVEKQKSETRSKAQDAIKAGRVSVNGTVVLKNSFSIREEDDVQVAPSSLSFVSRAGYKLYDVISDFHLDLKDKVCMDVGASTGGFSDVCLKQGAKLVYAIDVGCDQLDQTLRQDARVINMEHTNCRYLTSEMFSLLPQFACMDVSFISIKLILPAIKEVMKDVDLVALIKPQFEAGKEHIGKHGIVKDKKIHVQVLKDMVSYVQEIGLYVHHLQGSSILGRDGNKEFVMHIMSKPCTKTFDYKKIVEAYHCKHT